MLDLSDHSDLALLSQVIADAQHAFPDAEYMLVGAMARDLRLTYAHGIAIARGTADIDLALAVRGWHEFREIRKQLVASGRFTETSALQRMRHVSGTPLDIVPYGENIEGPGSRIEWPPDCDVRSRVIGYREARAAAEIVRLPNNVEIHVATLPGLLILKLFAFEDRAREVPRKDAEDIHFILRNYTDAGNRDRLFTEYQDLLENPDFDYGPAGAHIAGRDVREVLAAAPGILDQLLALLTRELDGRGAATLLGQVAPQYRGEFEKLLLAFNRALQMR